MMIKTKDTDYIFIYRQSDAEGRLSLMMENFAVFPKVIRKAEKKTMYRIRAEREYLRSHSRDELGVRVQSSKLGDITADEAVANVTLEEAFRTGYIDRSILKGMDDVSAYEDDIRTINIMRMDYELLEEIIEDLDKNDTRVIKQYLLEGRLFKEIADDEGRTYEAIKKRVERIRRDIREEIIACLELNCRED